MDRRAELLFKKRFNNLQNANVLVVGLGGVGSFAAEFLARAGVGTMTIVDGDVVDITNINRQLPAFYTVGQPKITVVGDRLMDINPGS
jgi:tRNA A37 threonylcarbamoyladenosine dehydratase